MRNCSCQGCKAQSIIEGKEGRKVQFAITVKSVMIKIKGCLIEDSGNIVRLTSGVESVRTENGESLCFVRISPVSNGN